MVLSSTSWIFELVIYKCWIETTLPVSLLGFTSVTRANTGKQSVVAGVPARLGVPLVVVCHASNWPAKTALLQAYCSIRKDGHEHWGVGLCLCM